MPACYSTPLSHHLNPLKQTCIIFAPKKQVIDFAVHVPIRHAYRVIECYE